MYELSPTVRVYERDDWKAEPAKPGMLRQAPPSQAFLHHGAEQDSDAKSITSVSAALKAMHGIQAFHMGPARGWDDVGYHYVIFQPHGALKHAVICEGRLVHFVPAAQLGHNTDTFAVCVYGTIDQSDPLQDGTVWALTRLLGGVRAGMTGAGHLRTLGGHRDVTQTDCPGAALYGELDRIAKGSHLERFHA